jgi:hypothetical protein
MIASMRLCPFVCILSQIFQSPDFYILYLDNHYVMSTETLRTREVTDTYEQKKKHNFLFQCGSKMGDRAREHIYIQLTLQLL